MSNTVATIRKDSPSPSEQPEATPANSSLQTIIVERRDRVGLITLNRPKSLNALNGQLAIETLAALKAFDADDQVGAVVITGSARAFAAGADIAEMAEKPFTDFYMNDFLGPWDEVRSISKPIIAAVGGFALGGGCELAMLCDFIIASEDAQFGQPEIKLGILPGIGGSQRLTRAIGKSLAMDLILTGRTIGADRGKGRRSRCARRTEYRSFAGCVGSRAYDRRLQRTGGEDGEGSGQSRVRGTTFGGFAP